MLCDWFPWANCKGDKTHGGGKGGGGCLEHTPVVFTMCIRAVVLH